MGSTQMVAIRRRAACGVIVVALAAACSVAGERPSGDADGLARRKADVQALIGEPSCNSVAQCRAAPLGAKPCGGPWSYAVYSTVTTDSSALAAAISRYNAHENELNRREGRVSDCRFVAPPRLDCADGRCVGTPMSLVKPDAGSRTRRGDHEQDD